MEKTIMQPEGYLTRSEYGQKHELSPQQITSRINGLREPAIKLYNGRKLIKEDFPSVYFSGYQDRPYDRQEKRRWERIYKRTFRRMNNQDGY
jgi:hypothetical protein